MASGHLFRFPAPRNMRPLLRADVRLRTMADALHLSRAAKLRLAWIQYAAATSVSAAARHFGISRRTLCTWRQRFDPLDLSTLEASSRAPHHVRRWQVTPEQETRILTLKRAYPHWGKAKLQVLYQRAHGEQISQWSIQRVLTRHQCFPAPARVARIVRKRQRALVQGRRKRIQELALKQRPHFLWQLDTIIRHVDGTRRYFLTAIDHVSKLGFVRAYPSKASRHAADFLRRLQFLTAGQVQHLQTDNGSEFAGAFAAAAAALDIPQYFSRVRTPKDNAVEERFNRTVSEEFLSAGHLHLDATACNAALARWILEYNTVRPHQSLNYRTPLEFLQQHKVRRMWSSTTCT